MNCPELPQLLDSHVMSPCLLANSTFWLKSRCVIMPCFFRWIHSELVTCWPGWNDHVCCWNLDVLLFLFKIHQRKISETSIFAWASYRYLQLLCLVFGRQIRENASQANSEALREPLLASAVGPRRSRRLGAWWADLVKESMRGEIYVKSSFWENPSLHIPPIQASFILLPWAQNEKTAFETCSKRCLESGGANSNKSGECFNTYLYHIFIYSSVVHQIWDDPWWTYCNGWNHQRG